MSYNSLLPLMKRKGCSLPPEQFQERVNIVFHDHEAALYDEMHADMKNSLQEQVDLLVADLLKSHKIIGYKLNILDVGCGTGLSTEYLLNTNLSQQIESLTLLDTSEKMLQYAEQKAKTWDKEYRVLNKYITDVEEKFDLVLLCSVLHHIPDLKTFLKDIDRVLNPGGILIHLQDPNGDCLSDKKYDERVNEFEKKLKLKSLKKNYTSYIPKSIKSKINRLLGRKNYIDLVNDQLLEEKVIKKRMSADEIWSVTDIHVETKEKTLDKGISIKFLKQNLQDFSLISHRSYGFYGKLKFDLDEELRKNEEKLIAERQLNGRNVSGVWIKN